MCLKRCDWGGLLSFTVQRVGLLNSVSGVVVRNAVISSKL